MSSARDDDGKPQEGADAIRLASVVGVLADLAPRAEALAELHGLLGLHGVEGGEDALASRYAALQHVGQDALPRAALGHLGMHREDQPRRRQRLHREVALPQLKPHLGAQGVRRPSLPGGPPEWLRLHVAAEGRDAGGAAALQQSAPEEGEQERRLEELLAEGDTHLQRSRGVCRQALEDAPVGQRLQEGAVGLVAVVRGRPPALDPTDGGVEHGRAGGLRCRLWRCLKHLCARRRKCGPCLHEWRDLLRHGSARSRGQRFPAWPSARCSGENDSVAIERAHGALRLTKVVRVLSDAAAHAMVSANLRRRFSFLPVERPEDTLPARRAAPQHVAKYSGPWTPIRHLRVKAQYEVCLRRSFLL
mmetsp:Transcript_104941/g.306518  ORF Transcript_104941/g.306518 Transcript_104941/m.306518 type:complete len:362 (-) Transcript_104941:816-1901(-)